MGRKPKAEAGVAETPQFDLLAPPAPAVFGIDGHRERMRGRLLTAGPEALADHEMLEMVLFLALPRRDTKPIARALLARFGSFAAVIAAPLPDLLRVDGMGDAAAAALKLVQAAALRLARGAVLQQPLLAVWQRMLDYLLAALAHEKVEQFRVLFLDSANRLIADEVLGRGTVNHAPVYPREIVRRALELHANAVMLVHNHPSGDPTPSREDLMMTRQIQAAAETLRITVHDHIVIAGSRWLSFRQEGLL